MSITERDLLYVRFLLKHSIKSLREKSNYDFLWDQQPAWHQPLCRHDGWPRTPKGPTSLYEASFLSCSSSLWFTVQPCINIPQDLSLAPHQTLKTLCSEGTGFHSLVLRLMPVIILHTCAQTAAQLERTAANPQRASVSLPSADRSPSSTCSL